VRPVALEGHYFLIVLDIRQHTLFLYDSLGYQQNDVCQLALQWLKKESEWRGNVLDVSEMKCYKLYGARNKPQQDDCNCGVYLLMHVYSLLLTGQAMPAGDLVINLADKRR
jgi:Ulp1 family protease